MGRTRGLTMMAAPLAGLAAMLLAGGARAEDPRRVSRSPAAVSTPSRADVAALGPYIDGIVGAQIAGRDVAGAVVLLIADGKVVFKKGYGYADLERRIPFDPDTTIVRPASVSKLLTWTALMQLVELGQVDLDRDVNDYLDFRIPDTFAKPIRVRDLLDHSAGFEDLTEGMFAKSPSDYMALGPWLSTHIPKRVRQPGVEISYSNYSAVVAGYIVERVSGEPFPAYIGRHLLGPLGMENSTFREPLPPAWAPRIAKGYELVDDQLVEQPFELLQNTMPAGGLSTTAADMARFAIAHLQDGRYGRHQILRAETAQRMRGRMLTNAPDLPGLAHGFIEYRTDGPRIVGHAGNTEHFHSFLLLAPAPRVGLYVTMTGGNEAAIARYELVDLVFQRLFPEARSPLWSGPDAVIQEGFYVTNRRPYRTQPGIVSVANAIKVSARADGGLVTETRGGKTYWERIGPRMFQPVADRAPGGPLGKLEFVGDGTETRMSFERQPQVLYRFARAP